MREVLHGRDPELTRRILDAHQLTMEARLAETERIVAELQSGLAPVTHTPVHVRLDPARDTVRIAGVVTEAEFADWLAWAFDRLSTFLTEVGATPAGPAGGLYAAELADDGIEEVEAFVPIAEPLVVPPRERDVSIGEVPAARVAVLVHAGDYDSIADTYRTLGAWVARTPSTRASVSASGTWSGRPTSTTRSRSAPRSPGPSRESDGTPPRHRSSASR